MLDHEEICRPHILNIDQLLFLNLQFRSNSKYLVDSFYGENLFV